MKLAAWLNDRSMSAAEFADKVGVHRSTVGRWIDGEVKPSWDQLPKIQELTAGQVTPNDFRDEGEAAVASPSEAA
jgi:DNA-binding transcriptional regulator YdaS (Cro superfamily)